VAERQHPPPRVFRIGDGHGLVLQLSDLGATWLSCRVPVPGAAAREVLLGHAEPEHYLHETGYLGGIIGRWANRIAGAAFTVDGRRFALAANEGGNQLHGGPDGFHRRRWTVRGWTPRQLELELVSPDGDQGFPGELTVNLRYRVDGRSRVSIAWQARCSRPCPVNLTSHAYFNLDPRHENVAGHRLQLAAAQVLAVDPARIPTGARLPVADTPFDFRSPAPALGPQGRGFDHCWVLDEACRGAATPAARLTSADGKLALEMRTTLPGLQYYSGERLDAAATRDGARYRAFAGVALEPQFFPDSPNRPEWQADGCVLRPERVMSERIEYRFVAAPG